MSNQIKVQMEVAQALAAADDLVQKFKAMQASGEATGEELQAMGKAAGEAQERFDSMGKEIEEAAKAGLKFDDMTKDLQELEQAARKAADELEKTGDKGNKVAAAGERTASAAGGLEKILAAVGLAGLGGLFGSIEALILGIKDVAAGAEGIVPKILKIGVAVGSVTAILYSLWVLWDDYQETVEQVADSQSLLDGTLLKIGTTLGFVAQETAEVADWNRKADKATEDYTARMESHRVKMVEVSQQSEELRKAIDEYLKSLDQAKEDEGIRLEVSGIDNVATAESRIDAVRKRLEELRKLQPENASLEAVEKRNRLLEEGLRKGQAEMQALQDRIQAIKDLESDAAQKKKEAQAAEADRLREIHALQLKAIADERTAMNEAHKARLEEIAAEKAAQEASDAQAKAAIDARIAAIKGGSQAGGGASGGGGGSGPAPNPYGEGTAPTAGQGGQDPFLAALGDLPSFGYGGKGVAGGFVGDLAGSGGPGTFGGGGGGVGGGESPGADGGGAPGGLEDAIVAELEKTKQSGKVLRDAIQNMKNAIEAEGRKRTAGRLLGSLDAGSGGNSGEGRKIRSILDDENVSEDDLSKVNDLIKKAVDNGADVGGLGFDAEGIQRQEKSRTRQQVKEASTDVRRRQRGEDEPSQREQNAGKEELAGGDELAHGSKEVGRRTLGDSRKAGDDKQGTHSLDSRLDRRGREKRGRHKIK
jgi:membrane protein involved in colicin uptake